MSKLLKAHLRFWVRLFWTSVFVAIILVAVLVQIGRTLFPVVNDYRTAIESQLSRKLGVDISIGEIEAVWQGLRPNLSLNDVSLMSEMGEPVFEVGEIEVEISLIKSLLHRSPSFRQLEFRRLEATLVQTPDYKWRVKGLPESTAFNQGDTTVEADAPRDLIIDDPLDIFLFGRRVRLSDTSLDFVFLDQLKAAVVIPDIRLENDTQFHRLRASFALDGRNQEVNLVVEGYGDPRDETAFEASGYLTLSDFPIEKFFAVFGVHRDALLGVGEQADKQKWLDEGKLDLNLWFDRNTQQGLSWQGDVTIEGVPFTPREGMIWPNTVTSNFMGQWSANDGWFLGVKDLDLQWEEFATPPLSLTIQGESFQPSPEQPLYLQVQEFDVSQWYASVSQAGLLPKPISSVLDVMQPKGTLKNISVNVIGKAAGYFGLKANVEQASIKAWQGVPEIRNVNGYIESSAFEGHVAIDSRDGIVLNFPKIYQHELQFEKALGDVRWEIDLPGNSLGFSSGQIELSSDEVEANGHLFLDIPLKSSKDVEPEMTLSIGVKRGVASLHKLLIPYTVPENLNEWMDRSIKEGLLTDAGFIYHGSLMGTPELGRSIQFGSGVEQATLKFDPLWPALIDAAGILLLDDDNFRVTNLSGRMMDISLTSGEVELVSRGEGDAREQAVSLSARVTGDSGHALNLLKHTPIAHILGEELSSWEISGPVSGRVKVLVPLKENSPNGEQDIRLQVDGNSLHLPGLNLTFNEVSGPLTYTHVSGISSDNLQAQLWGQKLQANVRTSGGGDDTKVTVSATGHIDVAHLRDWSERPELGFAEGVTPVELGIQVPLESGKPILFRASSDLSGVSLSLPSPFSLTEEATTPLVAEIKVYSSEPSGNARHQYRFELAEKARVAIDTSEGEFLGMSVALNTEFASVPSGAIGVSGTLQRADVLEWAEALEAYDVYVLAQQSAAEQAPVEKKAGDKALIAAETTAGQFITAPEMGKAKASAAEDAFYPLNLVLEVEQLFLGELEFERVAIKDSQTLEAHHFEFQGESLVGQVKLYSDESRVMDVDLDYLHIPDDEGPEEPILTGTEPVLEGSVQGKTVFNDRSNQSPEATSGLVAIDVQDLPEMNFHVKKFINGKLDFGEWSFKLRGMDGGVTAHNLHAQVLGLKVQGKTGMDGAQLIWLQNNGKNESFFSGLVTARDLGPVMESWDLERMLTSESASFDTDVQWLGAPSDIELERLFGIINVEIKKGRFIRGAEVGENPLVKLIGLLNFDTLARRFRLDFSDLHPEGMSYDMVKGEFHFHRGMVQTPSPLLVDMTASDIQFLGDIDVIGETVDAQLVVTLPLAGLSTTAIAALTGGVPLAVGVFVASKIFKRQVDQASSLRYTLSGPWEDPDVDLEKVFSADVEKKSSVHP